MTEEIKEILDDLGNKDNYIEEFGYQYKRISLYDSFQLLDYITNLQQDLDKANDIIEKDRQFYKCRMNEYADYKSRLEKASNKLDSMFANGEENKILDDLLELDKIVKGDKQ